MTKQHLKLPEQNVREYAHQLAYELAREQLAGIKDIERQCGKSGTQYLPSENAIIIDYLNRPYRLNLTSGEVTYSSGNEDVPLRDKILILHYFNQAKGTPLSGDKITYKELTEGIHYFPVFSKRAIEPIVTFFGKEPEKLLSIAESLGGHKAEYGNASVTINAFRYVPITIVLWRGDDEFTPEGSLLFDSTISDYLTNDDIHALCENIAWRLVRLL